MSKKPALECVVQIPSRALSSIELLGIVGLITLSLEPVKGCRCLGFLAKECVNKQVSITTCATPGALDELHNRRFFPPHSTQRMQTICLVPLL